MTLSSIASLALVPPANLPVLLLAGVAGRRRQWGQVLVVLSGAALFLFSLPIVAEALVATLGDGTAAPGVPQAIVVLGAEVERAAIGGPDLPGPVTLQRLRTAAETARRTGLPVLVSGGSVDPAQAAVGDTMARSLQEDFGVGVRWVENRSLTTWENAQDSAPMLREAGIGTVLLVTSSWHMRRSQFAFAQTGLVTQPVPAPGGAEPGTLFWRCVPRASAWLQTSFAFHEWFGLLWYEARAAFAGEH